MQPGLQQTAAPPLSLQRTNRSSSAKPRLATNTAEHKPVETKTVFVRLKVPVPRDGFSEPATLLKAFGRGCEKKVKIETWEELFQSNGESLDKLGVSVKDRKYVMWCLEKFRQGFHPLEFAKEPRPKKKVRGWGPPVPKKKIPRSQRAVAA